MTRQIAMVTAILALSACGGGSITPAPTPTPSFYSCIFSGTLPPSTLLSPAPGAIGVPDSTATLLFSNALETPYGRPDIQVTFGPEGFYETSAVTATATGYSVALPTLMAHTSYTVIAMFTVATNNGACDVLPVNEGEFTTQ
ncbi:MAG: hypothetical protein ABR949_13665 [Candidatus Aquilonibacter sp.]|jgi:hypothetical protein